YGIKRIRDIPDATAQAVPLLPEADPLDDAPLEHRSACCSNDFDRLPWGIDSAIHGVISSPARCTWIAGSRGWS
ncbi:MAG: hypothetical protein M3470_01885, partial [Chloroflexota bacterium]|nr:hypothetical protein [Chloroflexota bacterium]